VCSASKPCNGTSGEEKGPGDGGRWAEDIVALSISEGCMLSSSVSCLSVLAEDGGVLMTVAVSLWLLSRRMDERNRRSVGEVSSFKGVEVKSDDAEWVICGHEIKINCTEHEVKEQ